VDMVIKDFQLLDLKFAVHQRVPRTVCATPLDLIDITPDGVQAKPLDPSLFDIHIDAEAYDELIAFIMAQRALFTRYGYRVHTIAEGLYTPGDMKAMRAKVPRCEVDGIERLARAGML